MKKLLLVDADIVAYQAAVSAQYSGSWTDDEHHVYAFMDKTKATTMCDQYVQRAKETTGATDALLCLSGKNNFRHDVVDYYKWNRSTTMKPIGLGELKDWILRERGAVFEDKLEADDLMGIYATDPDFKPDYQKIIVSEDKDLQTIPAYLYNPAKDDKERKVELKDADFFLYCQILAGDTTDGYSGCPTVGMKTAEKLLEKEGVKWSTVVNKYKSKGLGESVALENARLARILRHGDYDFDKQEVNLWKP